MKFKAFAAALLAVIALSAASSVEARCHRSSHVSLNLGAVFAPTPEPAAVVVENYYPYEPVYLNSSPYVAVAPTPVYVSPRPVVRQVYVVPQRPVLAPGLSFSWNFFR